METITRFFRVEPQSFFLLGPRGTGKSTFVRANFPDALYIDLLQPDVLRHGMIPVVVGSPDPEATLHSYVDLYLREEIQAEGLTRNIGNFTRFLEAASFSHGSQLTVSNISRECGVERKTVEGYLSILEDLLLTFRVPVFTRKAKRATVSHPKFYFFDTGLYNALRPKGPLDRPEGIGGATGGGLGAPHPLAR